MPRLIKPSEANTSWPVKPVFPLLYGIVVFYAISMSFYKYMASLPLRLTTPVDGGNNILAINTLVAAFLIALSIYVMIYYIRLELLEDSSEFSSRRRHTPLWMKIIEVILRFCLASFIALKVIQFGTVSGSFLFLAITTTIIVSWMIFSAAVLKCIEITRTMLFGHSILWFLSMFGLYLSSSNFSQEQNAMFIIIICVLSLAFIFLIVWATIDEMWSAVSERMKRYVNKWSV